MNKLKFAIVGCGRISDLHAPGYLSNPFAEIYAICDLDKDKAINKAIQWGVKKENIYTNFTEMLKNKTIDAVELLVPHNLHAPLTIEACEAGKHVSVQKPMANSISECDEMITAANKAGVKFRVFENFRFYPPYIFAKKLIDEGKLGRISSIHIKLGNSTSGGWDVPIDAWMWRFVKEDCGGGPICWDDGYHKFSIARWFINAEIEKVFGWIDHTGAFEDNKEPMIDSPAKFIWKYALPRTYGSMEVTYSREGHFTSTYYSADERVEITGDKGYVWINQCTANTLKKEAPIISYISGKLREYHNIETDWISSFTNAINHFIDAIRDDTQPEVNPEEAKRVQQFATAAHRSSQTHKEEKPEEMVD